MKKISYPSLSLHHIISSAILIVILLILAACFLWPASVIKIIFLTSFTICTICMTGALFFGLYLMMSELVAEFITNLKDKHDKNAKHHTT